VQLAALSRLQPLLPLVEELSNKLTDQQIALFAGALKLAKADDDEGRMKVLTDVVQTATKQKAAEPRSVFLKCKFCSRLQEQSLEPPDPGQPSDENVAEGEMT